MLFDAITLVFGVLSAYAAANTLLFKFLHIKPMFDDDLLVFTGNFFFYFGVPFTAIYTSRFTSQSVYFDTDGITVDSLIEKQFLSWQDLEAIKLTSEYVYVSRLGQPMPKELQKSLRLDGKEGQTLLINEPQLRSVKRKIISAFRNFAPETMRAAMDETLDKW